MPIFPVAAIPSSSGWNPLTVDQSVMFDGAADYLRRTPANGSTRKFTASGWWKTPKPGNSSAYQMVLPPNVGVSGSDFALFGVYWEYVFVQAYQGSYSIRLECAPKLRDIAWNHLVIAVDTEQAVASDRVKIWVNGILQTEFVHSTYPTLNLDIPRINSSSYQTTIGCSFNVPSGWSPSYHAQIAYIDGNGSYTAEDFGQWVAAGDNGAIWAPRPDADVVALVDAAGGVNSLCLTSEIGDGIDASANGNDFTPTSMSHAANGSSDTPSNNHAVLNPLTNTGGTISNGALTLGGSDNPRSATLPIPDEGNWFVSAYVNSGDFSLGIIDQTGAAQPSKVGRSVNSWGAIDAPGAGFFRSETNSTGTNSTSASSAGNFVAAAYKAATGELWLGRNQGAGYVWLGGGDPAAGTSPTYTVSRTGTLFFAAGAAGGLTLDFGQNGHYGSVPTGFNTPLNSANNGRKASDPQGADWFQAQGHTGDAATPRSFTGSGFPPDFEWIKDRSGPGSGHLLFDRVRGAGNALFSHDTAAETANPAQGYLSAFDADGSTYVNGGSGGNNYNANTQTYIRWLFRAGGAPVANNDGSISSQVSVAAAGHFSLIGHTGTGANGTIGHGLPGAPELHITKQRTSVTTLRNWTVGGSVIGGGTSYLGLNSTAAVATDATVWNSTLATGSVIHLGTFDGVNGNTDTYITLAFRSVPGLLRVGRFTGNTNVDGPYEYLGFRARWILFKAIANTTNWFVFDTVRKTINPLNTFLQPNTSGIEETSTSYNFDVLSDGFKIRGSSTDINATGGILYIAIADVAGGGELPPVPGR